MTKAVWGANTAMIALNATTKRNILFMTAGVIAAGIAYLTSKLGEFGDENRKLQEDLQDTPEVFSREQLLAIQRKWDIKAAKEAIERKKKKDEELIELEKQKFLRLQKIQKEQAERRRELEIEGHKQFKKDQEDTLAILSQSSRRAFQAFKAWKISEAIIDAYGAFNKALNSGYPPPLNFALAASSVALGFAKVSAIRSQTYSGRAGGGPVSAEQAYRVGERGPEMFVPGSDGYIMPNDSGKMVNINFTINAVDTTGFQQLLANERGMIVSMVNSAMNQQGKANLI